MRFVPIKTGEQQAALVLHRTRDLLIRQRTMLANALRGHMAEFGIIAPQGIGHLPELVAVLQREDEAVLPRLAREVLQGLAAELETLAGRIEETEAAIPAWHKASAASRRLAQIPSVGPIIASALVATVDDASQFVSARHFTAWLGLVPRQNSSGGKPRQGGISKAGDRYLRKPVARQSRGLASGGDAYAGLADLARANAGGRRCAARPVRAANHHRRSMEAAGRSARLVDLERRVPNRRATSARR